MSLLTIEEEAKTLTRAEKLQLIADITKMLQEEEPDISEYFDPDKVYEVVSQNVTPDNDTTAVHQLQTLLEEQSA